MSPKDTFTSSLENQKDKLVEENEEIKEKVEDFYKHTKEQVADLYEEGVKQVCHAQEHLKEYSDEVIQYVKDKPLTSLLIAGSVGFIISSLLRK